MSANVNSPGDCQSGMGGAQRAKTRRNAPQRSLLVTMAVGLTVLTLVAAIGDFSRTSVAAAVNPPVAPNAAPPLSKAGGLGQPLHWPLASPAGSAPGPGYVAETLVLINHTVVPGNYVAQPNGPASVAYDALTDQVWEGGNVLSWSGLNSTLDEGTLSPGSPSLAYAILLDSSTQTLYAAEWYLNCVTVVNATAHSITGKIPVGANPVGLAFDPIHSELLVANSGSNNVSVISTTNNTVVSTIPLPDYPSGIAYDPVSSTTFVSVYNKGYVEVINDTSKTIRTRVGLPTSFAYGSNPEGIAYDSANDSMLVAEWGPDAVAVVNATNLTYENTTSVKGAAYSVVVDNGSRQVFVSTFNSLDVLQLNLSTTKTLAVGQGSFGFDAPSGRLFFAYFGGVGGGVWQINTTTDDLGTYFATSGPSPLGIAFDPLTGAAITADFQSPDVTIVNLSTAQVGARVIQNSSCYAALYDAFTQKVLLSDSGVFGPFGVRSVYVLNATAPYALNATLTVGGGPLGLALNTNGSVLGVADANSNTLTLVKNFSLQTTVHVGSYPMGVAYDSHSEDFYVTNDNSNNVSVVNATTGGLSGTISVCSAPAGAAFDPLLNSVFVACGNSNSVDVINDSSHTVADTLPVGVGPSAVTYDPITASVFVANSGSNNVSIFNARTGTLTNSLDASTDPVGLALNPVNGTLYVTDYVGQSVSVIEPCPRTSCLSLTGFKASPNPVVVGGTTNLTVRVTDPVGPPTYVYSGLPAGCGSQNTSNLSCRPTSIGEFNVSVLVHDLTGTEANLTTSLTVDAPPQPAITSVTVLPTTPIIGVALTLSVEAKGGLPPLSFDYAGLPPGCSTANASNLTCTPESVGNFTVNVTVTDAMDRNATGSLSFAVQWHAGPPSISSFTIGPSLAPVNSKINITVAASGGWGALAYGFQGLPVGCPDGNRSFFTCFPTMQGSFRVVATVTDGEGRNASASTTLQVVAPAPEVQSFGATPNPAMVGQSVHINAAVTGGEAPLTYTYTGLPGGCSGTNSSTPTCTPSVAQTSTIRLAVSDRLGRVADASLSLVVNSQPVATSPEVTAFTASPNPVSTGTPTVFVLVVQLGAPPYSESYAGLPTGCSASNTTEFNCTPTQAGIYSVTVRVTDAADRVGSSSLSLDVLSSNASAPGNSSSPVTALNVNALLLVSQKESLPFTRDEGRSAWVAGVDTMGLGPRS